MTATNFFRQGMQLAAIAALLCAAPSTVGAAYEAQLYAITNWNAGCSGGTRNAWDDMGDAWYDEITDNAFFWGGHGFSAYTRDRRRVNGNIADSWFTDTAIVGFGNDTAFLDEGDAAMVCTHGSESSGRWFGKLRIDEAGSGNCNAWQGHMELGDSDLEFLHLSSCNSLDDNQWSRKWLDSFKGLHLVTGFHGIMYISEWRAPHYRDFSEDAFESSIADAWIDNLYFPDTSGSDDQCPVAYGAGSSEVDLWQGMRNERYDNVYSDPEARWWGAIYIAGCDPLGEDACGDGV